MRKLYITKERKKINNITFLLILFLVNILFVSNLHAHRNRPSRIAEKLEPKQCNDIAIRFSKNPASVEIKEVADLYR